jgi:hypothetical protein
MSEYDGSSNILAKYVNIYSTIAYRIVGEDRVTGGVSKITYLYNLRTCKLTHFVSTEDLFQIKNHDGKGNRTYEIAGITSRAGPSRLAIHGFWVD